MTFQHRLRNVDLRKLTKREITNLGIYRFGYYALIPRWLLPFLVENPYVQDLRDIISLDQEALEFKVKSSINCTFKGFKVEQVTDEKGNKPLSKNCIISSDFTQRLYVEEATDGCKGCKFEHGHRIYCEVIACKPHERNDERRVIIKERDL
jgi:hypothetical protein